MTITPSFSPMTSPVPGTTAQDAEALTAHFTTVMDALRDVLQQETDLVRSGRLGAAAKFQEPKADLTRLYIADASRLRASQSHLARVVPAEKLEALRQRHDSFRALLEINLTVLATAHSVSEGIVRGVSGEMARKATPQTYGASGRSVAPPPGAAQPLALSRML
jgi:hypothetical protein